MPFYIRSAGNISPQPTFGREQLDAAPVDHAGDRLCCIEPDYKNFIDAKFIRRMSRIIRMGVAAAMECLREAELSVPDAIVTGTAYGCLEDTGVFLSKMIGQQEELLAPTAFIQSTHNTVGAQIALLLHCTGYNNVFVHRGFSFENALLDAMLLLQEGDASQVLVGGVDEITDYSHAIMSRFGLYKQDAASSLQLFSGPSKGTIAGEGAAFFLLAAEPSGKDLARLNGLATFYNPVNLAETESRIWSFLEEQEVNITDIDLVILGRNGDASNDQVYEKLCQSVFKGIDNINFKQLCGEYPTATAFATWLAATIIAAGELPALLINEPAIGKRPKNILVYNHTQNKYHSLLLITAC